MGVSIGTLYGTGATGWSSATPTAGAQDGYNGSPPGSAATTMVIHVSSSTGNDADSRRFGWDSADEFRVTPPSLPPPQLPSA